MKRKYISPAMSTFVLTSAAALLAGSGGKDFEISDQEVNEQGSKPSTDLWGDD